MAERGLLGASLQPTCKTGGALEMQTKSRGKRGYIISSIYKCRYIISSRGEKWREPACSCRRPRPDCRRAAGLPGMQKICMTFCVYIHIGIYIYIYRDIHVLYCIKHIIITIYIYIYIYIHMCARPFPMRCYPCPTSGIAATGVWPSWQSSSQHEYNTRTYLCNMNIIF